MIVLISVLILSIQLKIQSLWQALINVLYHREVPTRIVSESQFNTEFHMECGECQILTHDVDSQFVS